VEDIQNFLMDHILLRHNVITGRVECRVIERDYFQSLTPPLPLPYNGRGINSDTDTDDTVIF
jgi:hypothetical protein